MTRSASTPRLRLTLLFFVGLLVAAALTGARADFAPRSGITLLLDTVAPLLVAAACLGRIWCSVFIAGRKDATVVAEGPYAMCRHPLYTLSFAGGLGLALATHSIVLVALTLIVLATLFQLAATSEERFLRSRHGEAYACYAAATPRWWPRWSAWSIPDQLTVTPPVLWKAFVDAGAFFLLYVLLETARAARLAGWLPTLVTLP